MATKIQWRAFLNPMSFVGFVGFVLFSIPSVCLMFPHPPLDEELVTVNGTVLRAENEKGHKGDVDLVVTLQDDDVRLLSSMPYPQKFTFGSKTPEEIKKGERVTFVLNRREWEDPPKKNHRQGYLWREFVGMSTSRAVHLTPQDYEQWNLGNQRLGRFMFPVFLVIGLYLIGEGYWRTV
jgi:hypothetical protein